MNSTITADGITIAIVVRAADCLLHNSSTWSQKGSKTFRKRFSQSPWRIVIATKSPSFIRNAPHEYSTASGEKKIKSSHCYPIWWKLALEKIEKVWAIARMFAFSINSSSIARRLVCLFLLRKDVNWIVDRWQKVSHFDFHISMFAFSLIFPRDLMKTWMFLYQCHNTTVIHLPVTYVITT